MAIENEKIKIVLEFSGSGIKFFRYKILTGGTYNLMETVNIFKGGKIVEKFNNEADLKSLLKSLYDSGELYIFISNGHIEAIKKKTDFSEISKNILKIIKKMDEPPAVSEGSINTEDSITTEGTKAKNYFKDLKIDKNKDDFTDDEIQQLVNYRGDYSKISNPHYYGPETEDRLEANAFATLYDSGKITVVQDKQYPYCLLFAGSTTIQVMKISKSETGESIKYESETRPYEKFTKKEGEEEAREEGEEEEEVREEDKFFELLKGNQNVFFGSNFGWAFLYNEETSDVTMKKVKLDGKGIIKKYVDGENTEELYVKAEGSLEKGEGEGEGEIFEKNIYLTTLEGKEKTRRDKVTKNFEENTYLKKLKGAERNLYIDYLIDYKNCSYYNKDCQKSSQSKPNCCFSTINEESFDGFLSFCEKIFHDPGKYFINTDYEDLPTFYFFRTVKVDGVEVEIEITASRGLIDYLVGKINIPLPGTELHLSGTTTTGAGPPHVEGSMERPIKKKKTKKKGSTKQEKKRGSTKQEKKKGSTKKKNPKKKKTSTRKKI